MLYLITPDLEMFWDGRPAEFGSGVVPEPGRDLARFDWQPSGTAADETIVRLALRYGIRCSSGIVVGAREVHIRMYAADIRPVHPAASSEKAAVSAEDCLAGMLADAEPVSGLVTHWQSLGGRHPFPS